MSYNRPVAPSKLVFKHRRHGGKARKLRVAIRIEHEYQSERAEAERQFLEARAFFARETERFREIADRECMLRQRPWWRKTWEWIELRFFTGFYR